MKIYFCVFIFLCMFSLSSAQVSSPVLDMDGNSLRRDTSYYILPVTRGKGGGMALRPTSVNLKCMLAVAQESTEYEGSPLIFIPANTSKDAIICESIDLNIMFSGNVTICGKPSVWRREVMNQQEFISSYGTVGNPSRDTLSNWFKIEKYGPGKGYKLVYCPTVCNTCSPACGDIAVANDWQRTLILSNEPLVVMFKKAS
ncbi:kunitz trypsin inhibitor 5-like [Bidens hawaiensis]|uniref:kunitz trypsin inhibitor 5-like n=1 Tax=Bidens hawaiensis TaxID=980011 RepID=UPI00404B5BE5